MTSEMMPPQGPFFAQRSELSVPTGAPPSVPKYKMGGPFYRSDLKWISGKWRKVLSNSFADQTKPIRLGPYS